MSLQLVLGPSGAGKSHFMYKKIINEAMEHPDINYILLVPEQYSMALQRKMVMLHPGGGTMNIDVIGFNRLAYRVFDELNIKTGKVLEDFGKSMLIRQVAGSLGDKLELYKNCLNKPGFIDEVKALMSELYQYDISRDRLTQVIEDLESRDSDDILLAKLKDMQMIFKAFEDRIKEEYIVAEQLMELLNVHLDKSKLIQKSVIVMDGFTGFTPIQLKLISTLVSCAKKLYSIHTIDETTYHKKNVGEHELFYLTAKTVDSLRRVAEEKHIVTEPDILIGMDGLKRWGKDRQELIHLEHNIFRYPYEKYQGKPEHIKVMSFYNPRKQMEGVADLIYYLVKEQGIRYRDIAIITGDFENNIANVSRSFKQRGIPYFLDYTRPVKNNPYIDAIGHALRIVEEDFSYDSVFSFIKSGVIEDISHEDIELMENYVLARGIKGSRRFKMKWKEEVYVAKEAFLDIINPLHRKISGKSVTVSKYVEALRGLMDMLSYKDRLSTVKGLYDKLQEIFDKLLAIMADEVISVKEFREILELGLKELNLGVIPNTLDMVTVGDITRTRLDDVKVLFIIDVNDGIIPKKSSNTRIINDKDKARLLELGIQLAPTLKTNSFVEQFYLYTNMTKATQELYLSYCTMSSSNEGLRPSYLISRLTSLYTDMKVIHIKENICPVTTPDASVGRLVSELNNMAVGRPYKEQEAAGLYRLYRELGKDKLLAQLAEAVRYSNVPDSLGKDIGELIRLRMMSQSVSRLEQYAKCAYSYFLEYTLGIKERELSEVEARDTGNILHTAMERVYRYVHDNLDNDWSRVTEDQQDKLVTEFVENVWQEELGDRDLEEARLDNLKDTLVRIGKRTIRSLRSISDKKGLTPEYFEYRFTKDMALTDSDRLTIRGIVDRGDICYDGAQKSLTLRVIDYKSGNQKFELNKLYEGMQLQLAIYMNVMLSLVEEQYNKKNREQLNIIPDGMYYYTMKDPYIEIKDETELDKVREKELSLVGLEAKNPEDFGIILKYADKKAKDIAVEITEGNIAKEPMFLGNGMVCDYCQYADICRFDEKYGGNKKRYPRYKSTIKDQDKIMEKLTEELGLKEEE